VLRLLTPRAPGLDRSREQFESRTAPVFDALGAAATAADLTLGLLLDPARAARMVDFHRRAASTPDFGELLEVVVERVFVDPAALPPREAEIARVVQRVLVDRLEGLSSDGSAAPGVRARADRSLSNLLQRLDARESAAAEEQAHVDALVAEIGRHLARPAPPREPVRTAPPAPPGEPIGAGSGDLGGCGWGATD
jgi:hypothetical protein